MAKLGYGRCRSSTRYLYSEEAAAGAADSRWMMVSYLLIFCLQCWLHCCCCLQCWLLLLYIYISDFISCRGKPLQFFVFGSIEHILFDVCINSFLIIYYLLQCFVVSPCMLNMLGFCFYIVYNILDCCWYGGTPAIFYL